MAYLSVEALKDKIITGIQRVGDDELHFKTEDGETYKMFHRQNCCESVYIESIVGELDDLLNSPVLMAEEVEQAGDSSSWGTSTWTFYKLATLKGYVTIRWLGESNGCYSESVDFVKE
ncbi:hypothetical protein CN613_25530 [Bacillus pseudomycoides]|uniref:DUF7448 domain-containing protein n=1 Tax=Bacillus pseudomycoides TaxID=64104 RepID=A0A2A8BYI2_9BACI|nr:hypothetical protein [Bacillus pseudomycoides]PEM65308.1 hypothetical protein CN613_25530 [Bacillus pseudomycoides]